MEKVISRPRIPMPAHISLESDASGHLSALDGWRGISILLVLAAHLLPLGPKALHLNHASGVLGMVLFFVLSGFLITTVLLKNMNIPEFLVRRVFRIIPLAWIYLAVALAVAGASGKVWFAHFLFYANLPPKHLVPVTDHMWSVCVEMQFYLGIGVLVWVLGRRGLFLLPVLCVAVTGLRIAYDVPLSTITYFRLDEILAGCTAALVYHGNLGHWLRNRIAAVPQWLLLLLLCVSCLKQSDWVNYLRPYAGALLVTATLLSPKTRLVGALQSRLLVYVASISYALYVIHPIIAASWLGSGDIVEKYAKRPILFAVLFCIAHISTYYYERRWIALGKSLAGRLAARPGKKHAEP
jgi:peptidoglycan/LPS O-acetylase OafA/YrhL